MRAVCVFIRGEREGEGEKYHTAINALVARINTMQWLWESFSVMLSWKKMSVQYFTIFSNAL